MSSFINDTFKHSKLSSLTIKNRLSALSKYGLTKDNYVSVLSDVNKIDDTSKSINSRVTYLFHVIALLRELGDTDANRKLLSKYTSAVDKIKKQQVANAKANVAAKDTIPLKSLQKELNDNEPDFEDFISHPRTRDDTFRFYKAYDKHLLLSMYVNMPAIRNDLYACKIVNKKSDINDDENFILVSPRVIYLYLTQYKTAERYGSIRLEVGSINTRLIRNMLTLRKMLKFTSDKLFTHISSKGLSDIKDETALIQRIKKLSVLYFGKPLTINSFRHSWESHIQHSPAYVNATIAEREAMHMKLLHSLGAAQFYNTQTRD